MQQPYAARKKTWLLTIVILSTITSIPALAQQPAQAQTPAITQQAVQPSAQQADDEDVEIEEVLVTGSYIRGSALDAPSPVQLIDRASIEAQGAAQIWDVIKNLEINSGSISNENTDGALTSMGTLSGTANVNLRNLGENSTLTLINGKRQVAAATTTNTGGEFVDINTIPLVMVERIEVLTDGGSALYGSDAVAGVINVIMRTEFEGLEVYGDIQGMQSAGSLFDKTGSVIWGWASDDSNTHFVLAAEMFKRDPVPLSAARYFDGNSEFSGTVGGLGTLVSNPGFGSRLNNAYLNPAAMAQAGAEGGNALTPLYTDPLCATQKSQDGTAFWTGTRTAARGTPSSACREFNYQWDLLAAGMERNSYSGAFNHTFDDGTEFYSFAQTSMSDIERADSGVYGARGPSYFFAAPGSHLVVPGGQGQQQELGWYAPSIGLTRPTAATITNAPIALANGGPNVPMSAGVVIGNMPRTGNNNQMNLTETVGVQTGIKGDFTAFNRELNYDVSYSWSGTSFELEYKTYQRDRAELAVNGLGGPNCKPNGSSTFPLTNQPGFWTGATARSFTQRFFPGFVHTTRESLSLAATSNNQGQGGCQFYNPFLTSMTNPALANSQELIDWMLPTVRRADKRNKLAVWDGVVTGELMELSGGTAMFAVGAQYRKQSNKSNAPEMNDPGLPNAILGYSPGVAGVPNAFHYVSNNYECSMCIFNYEHDRVVNAVFGELSLPLISKLETQIAVRWEDYGGFIGDEITPKVAASYRPIDTLLVRASFSQSFRAPNIGVQKEGLEASSTTFRDPLRNVDVRSGLRPTTNEFALPGFSFTVGAPNEQIGNESANTYSTGFIWTPEGRLDGLTVNADIWRFEVKNRVMPAPGISMIQHELVAFNEAAKNPDNYIFNGSLATTLTGVYAPLGPYAKCNPVVLAARDGTNPATMKTAAGATVPLSRLDCVVNPLTYQVPNVVRTLGSTVGGLTTIFANSINAGEVEADGVDFNVSYAWTTDFGRLRLSSNFTYVRQYKLINVPGFELGLRETGLFDAAGTTGDGLLVRSLPDKKGNISFNWTSDSRTHSVTAIGRFIGEYDNLAFKDTYDNGNDYVRSVANEGIANYSAVDLQYNYVHQWANENLGTSTFTVGALDAFNATLPFHYTNTAQNYDAAVFDGRGRRLYARALFQF